MASYPWIVSHEKQQQDLNDFPNLKRWFESIQSRPATIAAYKAGEGLRSGEMSEADKKVLFGQTSTTAKDG